jgi:pimeloyl-ACP methyl ester carboxylesterase
LRSNVTAPTVESVELEVTGVGMAAEWDRGVVESRDGTPIGYVRTGSGPPLVIVHGAWASGDSYLPVAELLGRHFSCFVMDRRGRGNSGDGPEYGLECELADIEAVLHAAGQGATLLGHSGGGVYTLEVALRTDVSRLIVYEPPLRQNLDEDTHHFLDRFRDAVDDGRDEEATAMFFREMAGMDEDALSAFRSTPAWQERVPRAWTVLREMQAMVDAGLPIERYRSVSVPTLVLVGTETPTQDVLAMRKLHEVIPGSRIAELQDQAHLSHLTAPDLLADEVASFLATAANT